MRRILKQKTQKNVTASALRVVLIAVLSFVMVFSIYKIVQILTEYEKGTQEYNDIASSFVEQLHTYKIPQSTEPPVSDDGTGESDTSAGASEPDTEAEATDTAAVADTAEISEPQEEVLVVPSVNISYLEYKNEDFVGWLYLDGTALNYPVTQGEDNEYYLSHTFYGVENKAGCIFKDCRNDPEADDYNTIFYGHNMKNGTMFALLKKYARQDYFNEHKYIVYVTEDGPYVIKVFSAYTASVDADAWKINFDSEDEYARWLDGITEKSEINCGIDASVSDRVVTLSTCSFVFDNARFVVHGIIEPLFEKS